MKKIQLPKVNLKGNIKRVAVKAKIKSPTIMIVGGIAGVVVGTMMACKATMKLKPILDENKEAVDDIHQYMNEDGSEEYTEKDEKKAVAIEHLKTAGKVVKLYAPAVAVEAVSIGCIVGSHKILTKRNVGLAGAYAAVQKEFKDYRDRVVDRFGEDLDRELKYNISKAEYKEKETDESGKTKTVKKSVDVTDENGCSGYAKFFDEASRNWTKDPEHNKWFLNNAERYFNDNCWMVQPLLRLLFIFLN